MDSHSKVVINTILMVYYETILPIKKLLFRSRRREVKGLIAIGCAAVVVAFGLVQVLFYILLSCLLYFIDSGKKHKIYICKVPGIVYKIFFFKGVG